MLELINQLDGFDPRGNIKVIVSHSDLAQMSKLFILQCDQVARINPGLPGYPGIWGKSPGFFDLLHV